MGVTADLHRARRRLALDTLGIAVYALAFGAVFGLAARQTGLSPLEASAMSLIVFAGASQFAALGYLAAGVPWTAIVLLTFLLNARHLLYSTVLAPRLHGIPRRERAAMAHVLTDEAFALSVAHFARLGRGDGGGYWLAALGGVFVPWNAGTVVGVLVGGALPDPSRLGLDVAPAAAMAGLAAGLVTGRRELIAAGAGVAIAVPVALLAGAPVGILAGGLAGPLVALASPTGGRRERPTADTPHRPGATERTGGPDRPVT